MRRAVAVGSLVGLVVVGGCRMEDQPEPDAADVGVEPRAEQAAADHDRQGEPDLRFEVDVGARELHVYRNDRRTETHPVAVGTEEWPTRTGDFTIDEVVLNPRWVPPDEEWAEDEDEVGPGDPENPLGSAQLVYDRPRSIHGTIEPESIGQAASHGSIRVHNDVALALARMAMEAAGVPDVEERMRRAEREEDRSHTVRLPRGIPIRVTDHLDRAR